MKRLFRWAVTGLVVALVLLMGMYGFDHYVVAQTSTPSTTTPSQPAAGQQPVTGSPLDTISEFLDAVHNGDMDRVSAYTGGKEGALGIVGWSSTDLINYVGHTTFGKFRYCVTHNDGLNANVNTDGFMTFTDPSGFPAVKCVSHFWVDGDFKLKASGNTWVIVSLPGFQEPLCDSPTSWGPDPHIFPTPGDAI